MQDNRLETITPDDCALLGPVFERECQRLFPLPACIRLYITGMVSKPLIKRECPVHLKKIFSAENANSKSLLIDGNLIVPLIHENAMYAFFRINDVDPAILKKFSSGWLLEFQQNLLQQLLLVKDGYLNAETGLYNIKALRDFIEYPAKDILPFTVYLVSLSFVRRSFQGSSLKIQYFAGLLHGLNQGILFFLGQGLFALLMPGASRQERVTQGHHFQRRLKREALQKAHVASGAFQQGDNQIFQNVFKALTLAEERGPFGLCDTETLHRLDTIPFALPDDKSLRKLRRLWRGVGQFALLLFQEEKSAESSFDLVENVSACLAESEECVAAESGLLFVFMPEISPDSAMPRAQVLVGQVKEQQSSSFTVGVAFFPCLRFTKTDTVRNCRKAVLHGKFLGPGRVVFFDQLSLNVSGDWYFDEGNYRQAVLEYSQGLKLEPGEHNLLNSLGVALMEMKSHRQAIAAFQEVLRGDPENYMASVNLGYASLTLGREQEALVHFERAFSLQSQAESSGLEIYPFLSRLYCRFRRYEKALVVLLRWQQAEHDEGDYMLHYLLGEAYMETGHAQEAMKALQRALRCYPQHPDSMSMLGLLYIEKNEGVDVGLALLSKALEINEQNVNCWYRYSRAMLCLNRVETALMAVRKSLQIKRDNVKATILLGEVFAVAGRKKQALAAFTRAGAMRDITPDEKRAVQNARVGLAHSMKIQ